MGKFMRTTLVMQTVLVIRSARQPLLHLRGQYEPRHRARMYTAFLHEASLPWPSIDRVCPEHYLNGDREHPVVLPQGVGDEAG